MDLRQLLDPYFFVRKLSFSEIPLLVRFFGLREKLANYGSPLHDRIFTKVESWRVAWVRKQKRSADPHLILASYALAAGRCRDRLLLHQLGWGQLAAERILFVGAFILTAIQIAISSCVHLLLFRKLPVRHHAVCFSANRNVRASVERLFDAESVHHLDRYQYFLSWEAVRYFISTIAKAPLVLANPRLLSSFIRLLGQYCFVAESYQPQVIIGYFDSTPSISLITGYLRRRCIQHYNIMHGEIFYSCDHSTYVEVDRFYIWGKYYREILLRQHCPDGQFHILASPVLRDLCLLYREQRQPRSAILLLLHEPFIEQNHQVFENMLALLRSLDDSWIVVVRPHPAYTGDINIFVERIRGDRSGDFEQLRFVIESPRLVTPTESLSQSRIVASCVSTMLLEGWLAGCKLAYFSGVMDDSFILERYQGSPNVLVVNSSVALEHLRRFVSTPAELGHAETSRVDHVVCISATN